MRGSESTSSLGVLVLCNPFYKKSHPENPCERAWSVTELHECCKSSGGNYVHLEGKRRPAHEQSLRRSGEPVRACTLADVDPWTFSPRVVVASLGSAHGWDHLLELGHAWPFFFARPRGIARQHVLVQTTLARTLFFSHGCAFVRSKHRCQRNRDRFSWVSGTENLIAARLSDDVRACSEITIRGCLVCKKFWIRLL
jgi:hypothetical protein